MAEERDFELLDDYLTDRMSEEDRSSFEQKIQADPDLQHEYALQQRLIEGIKGARIAELKSMLNNVPVPANSPGHTPVSNFILGTIASIIIAAAGYWYFAAEDQTVTAPDSVVIEQERKAEEPAAAPPKAEESRQEVQPQPQQQQRPAVIPSPKIQADKNQTSAGTEQSKPSLAKRPDPLEAPAGKRTDQSATDGVPTFEGNTSITESAIVVETYRKNAQYPFHYQLKDGKLVLFGPFEEGNYEVMEFSAKEGRTLVLRYQDRFYLLKGAGNGALPLEPASDPALLGKLKEYRSSK